MKKFLFYVVLAELVYLVLVNAALQWPTTQVLVNQLRPEKFQVSWQNAWSFYPFRFHATGIDANGQSRSQQWQIHVDEAAGSISVLPLLLKRVRLRNLEAHNVDLRQRPRLQPERDYSHLLPHFPEIEGRKVLPADTSPPPDKRPWQIAVNGAELSGEHRLWVYQMQGRAAGEATADLRYETPGGPLSLDVEGLDLELSALTLNGDQPVFRRGQLSGRLDLGPMVPSRDKGVAIMEFLGFDLDVEVELISLAFINLFTLNLDALNVDGEGAARGHLRYERGEVLAGTELAVDAAELAVAVAAHDITGEGRVLLKRAASAPLSLDFLFEDLAVQHAEADAPLLAGEGLALSLASSGRVLPQGALQDQDLRLDFDLGQLGVPDLAQLQRYLPTQWPLQLLGGGGVLSGSAGLSTSRLDLDLRLASDHARASLSDYRFTTDLDLALRARNPDIMHQPTRVDGTYIRLGDARLQRGQGVDATPWQAAFEIGRGSLALPRQGQQAAGEDAVDLATLLQGVRASELLDGSRGELDFSASVSDLAWISLFFGGEYNAAVAGRGNLQGSAVLAGGLPAPDTEVEVRSEALEVRVLDYIARGDGEISLRVVPGEASPDWLLGVRLRDADMRREGDLLDSIEAVDMRLEARLDEAVLAPAARQFALDFAIDTARVTDMAVFDSYLPPDGPLRLVGGEAALTSAITLRPRDAGGWLRLASEEVLATFAGQQLRADLTLDAQLSGGRPADMLFELDGSTLLLDRVAVIGERDSYRDDDWSARLLLEDAAVQWRKPPRLDSELALTVSDTRPFVALFSNDTWRPKFLREMLTVENLEGHGRLQLGEGRWVVPGAELAAAALRLSGRGRFGGGAGDGRLLLRYDRAEALLKLDDGRKGLDLMRPRQKYEAFEVAPLPPLAVER